MELTIVRERKRLYTYTHIHTNDVIAENTHTHKRCYSISERLSNLPTVTQRVSDQASIHI